MALLGLIYSFSFASYSRIWLPLTRELTLSTIINHMVNQNITTLDKTFAALSDPTRRAILSRLTQGTATVTELAEPFAMSLPAVSKHLTVLEKAGLLTRQRQGRTHYLTLNATPLQEAAHWIRLYEQFWEGQLDALANFLEEERPS